MYKSKKEIEKKLEQVKYSQNLIRRYQGQVLANNGRDPSTGAHPLMVHISALISQGRSIVQYAYKEAEETGLLANFEPFAAKSDIFKLFKRLRDCDIHEYSIGVQTTIHATVYFDRTAHSQDPVSLSEKPDVEALTFPRKPTPNTKVVHSLLEKVETTESLFEELERSGQVELVQAARSGNDLYTQVELDGNKDLHELCDLYVTELENFIAYGQVKGFIS
jgi:hypothetical protein